MSQKPPYTIGEYSHLLETWRTTNQKRGYSIEEFCDLLNMGKTTYYSLMKEGNGPEIKKIGRRTLITIEAVEQWLNSRNNFATSRAAKKNKEG